MSKLTPEELGLKITTEGFRKAQADIIQTTKEIAEYQDKLKKLRYDQERMKSANKEGTVAYRKKTAEITKTKKAIKDLTDTLKQQEAGLGLTGMSYNQLKKKAGELTKELYNMSRAANPDQWKETSERLKLYQDQMAKMQQGIKMTNAAFKNQKPTVWSSLKQLIPIASITAIGAKLTSVANQAIQTFTRLDDKMADVQKTTQMSKAEVKALDAELMKINTRTSREDLLDLARVAGKLGVAKTEVAGFVRATDQIRVALSEDLGGDVEESIQKIGKLTSIFHLREEMGLEKSLLSVGSAINSLGADSEANEGYLVDFTNRTAGVAPQAKVSIQNVLGLGASLDQLGQSAEVAGTTYSQVMTGMYKKTDKYAKIAGMSVSDFSKLLREDANEAFLKFLEGANKTGDMEAMTKNLATLKLEGTRSTQVLGALAGNVDMIRQQQALANVEFAKATSLTEEYNTKNASAQALIEKRQKAIDQVVASLGEKLMPLWSETLGLTASFMSILKAMIGTLIEYRGVIIAVTTVTTALVAIKKLQHFYSKANRIAIIEEVVAIKTGTLATAKATTGTYALAAAKALVTLQFRAAAVAAKAFFLSLGPIGWAVTAITALVSVLMVVKTATKEASGAAADLALSLGQERATYEDLKKAVTDNAQGSVARAEGIRLINERYKEYLPNLITDRMTNEEIAAALDKVNQKMEECIQVRIKAQEMERIQKEQYDAEKEALTDLMSEYEAHGKRTVEQSALAQKQFADLIIKLRETGDKSAYAEGIAKVFGKTLQELQGVTQGARGGLKTYARLWGAIDSTFNDVTSTAKKTSSAIEFLNALINVEAPKKTDNYATWSLGQLNTELSTLNTKLGLKNALTKEERKSEEKRRGLIEEQIALRQKEITAANTYAGVLKRLGEEKARLESDLDATDGSDTTEIARIRKLIAAKQAEIDKYEGKASKSSKHDKWSLSSDEAYLKAKAELRDRQMKGDIASEEEYSRLLLALEIKTLEDRIKLNKEKDADLAKLKSELAEKEYQQTKNEQARTEKLLAAVRTPYESGVADYEKRLKELGLFGIDREQMTEDQQRALLKLEKEHRDKLYNLWLNGLSKQEAKRKEKNDAELRELRTKQNNELAAATTLEQKKAILRRWFSDADLQRVTTKEQAQKIITAKYQEEEQQMLKKHLEDTIATYNLLLSGAINPLFALGLTPEMRAKMQEELDKLQEELSKVNLNISQGDVTADTDKTKGKSNIDILGFSEEQWEDFFKKSESVSDSIGKWNMALQAVGNTFGMISDMMTAAENREFKKYEQTANRKKKVLERQLKSGTISQERYNEAVQRIDSETDAKREEMERKQAKRQKALAIFDAVTSTAVAVVSALGSKPWGPWNIALAALVGALGAVQIATIAAAPLPGAEEGGLIGVEREQDGKRFNAEFAPRKRGYVHRPTVIQTNSGQPVLTGEAGTEYVVPNDMLQIPEVAGMVSMIEAARLSGSFRSQQLVPTYPGLASGGYVGGAAPVSEPTVSNAATAATGYDDGVLRELKEVVGKLSRQLEKPIPTYISYLGRDGISTIQKKLEQQQRRAGIGGK